MIVTIGIAAGVGAVVRYLLTRFNRELPWGTLLANNFAVLSIPFFESLTNDYSTALVVGFAGALSTVSSFALEMTTLNRFMRLRYAMLALITCLASFEFASLLF